MSEASSTPTAVSVAKLLAKRLQSRGQEYALGGAIALGYWGEPRGTVDVDITLFLAPERPIECVQLLEDIGCKFAMQQAVNSFREHGFCRVSLSGVDVDVFLPLVPFYEVARLRSKSVKLGDVEIKVWDAESLAVFKMMFFRRKDLADIEQILRIQGERFDRGWVENALVKIFGERDLRISAWNELVREVLG